MTGRSRWAASAWVTMRSIFIGRDPPPTPGSIPPRPLPFVRSGHRESGPRVSPRPPDPAAIPRPPPVRPPRPRPSAGGRAVAVADDRGGGRAPGLPHLVTDGPRRAVRIKRQYTDHVVAARNVGVIHPGVGADEPQPVLGDD